MLQFIVGFQVLWGIALYSLPLTIPHSFQIMREIPEHKALLASAINFDNRTGMLPLILCYQHPGHLKVSIKVLSLDSGLGKNRQAGPEARGLRQCPTSPGGGTECQEER